MGVHSRGDASRVRTSQVADDEIVSCVTSGLTSCSPRAERSSGARGHRPGHVADSLLHPSAGDPELTE